MRAAVLRQIELDRLDTIHAALWPDAMAGNVKAVMALLRIVNAPLSAAWTA